MQCESTVCASPVIQLRPPPLAHLELDYCKLLTVIGVLQVKLGGLPSQDRTCYTFKIARHHHPNPCENNSLIKLGSRCCWAQPTANAANACSTSAGVVRLKRQHTLAT